MGLLGALGLSAGHMISTNGRRSPGIIKVEQEGYHFWFPLSLSLAFSVSISLSAHREKWHSSLKQNTQSFKGVLKLKCLFSKEDEDRSLRSALCEGGNHPPTDQPFPWGSSHREQRSFPWGEHWGFHGQLLTLSGEVAFKNLCFLSGLSLLSAFPPGSRGEGSRVVSVCLSCSFPPHTHTHTHTNMLRLTCWEGSYWKTLVKERTSS